MEKKDETGDLEPKVETAPAASASSEDIPTVSVESLSLQSEDAVKSSESSKPARQEISLANRQTKHLASGIFNYINEFEFLSQYFLQFPSGISFQDPSLNM